MGLFSFGAKDWNVIAVIFEKPDAYRINGNRGQGKDAVTMRDGAKNHARTIYYAVFDQKGGFVEGGPGAGENTVPAPVVQKLVKEIVTLKTVREVLKMLESGKTPKASKGLVWTGYPKEENRHEME